MARKVSTPSKNGICVCVLLIYLNVTQVSELFSAANIADLVHSWSSKPDHSLLSWNLKLHSYNGKVRGEVADQRTSFIRFDTSSIPNDFLAERMEDLSTCIRMLENEITTQESINSVYSEFADTIISEMKDKLSFKEIHSSSNRSNKRRRIRKPWWTAQLSDLWNELCEAEKQMLRSNGQARKHKREMFKAKRKTFDKIVQKEKRTFWRQKTERN